MALLFRVQDVARGDDRGHDYMITHDLRADRIQLWLVDDGRTLLEEARCKLEPGVWYGFEIEAQGRFVRYRLDGAQQLASEQADEYPAGRFYRNAKAAVIYEGTREIHKLMQADYALGFRQDKPRRVELPPHRSS